MNRPSHIILLENFVNTDDSSITVFPIVADDTLNFL